MNRDERLAVILAAVAVVAALLVLVLSACAVAIGDKSSARVEVKSPVDLDADVRREPERKR